MADRKVRIPFKSGDEWDYLTRARRFHFTGYGRPKRVKRQYQRRLRRYFKSKIAQAADV